MDGFVDYRKRDVQLPPGCKDLIDVLNRARKIAPECLGSISEWLPPGAQPERIGHGGLGSIRNYVTWLLTAAVKPSFLVIHAGAFPFHLFCETEAGPLALFLAIPEGDSERERPILSFFSDRCIDPAPNHPPCRSGWRVFLYPLPCVTGPAAALVITLLKSVYHVSEDTHLHFLCGHYPGGLG